MRKVAIIGWIIELAGAALWAYGYSMPGNPPLVDWHVYAPWWIADCLPNIEAEIGIVLAFAGLIPIYWPSRR